MTYLSYATVSSTGFNEEAKNIVNPKPAFIADICKIYTKSITSTQNDSSTTSETRVDAPHARMRTSGPQMDSARRHNEFAHQSDFHHIFSMYSVNPFFTLTFF